MKNPCIFCDEDEWANQKPWTIQSCDRCSKMIKSLGPQVFMDLYNSCEQNMDNVSIIEIEVEH